MSLNKSIITIRAKLQKNNLKKSGVNKFAGSNYFELADFLPRLNELMLEEEVSGLFTIENNKASLTLVKGEETQTYIIPLDALDNSNSQKEEKKETKATPSQIAMVLKVVSNIPQMLLYYKIDKIEDLTVQQASNIIANAKK